MPIDPVFTTVDYTSRDYKALRSFLISNIRERVPGWTADNPSDFGVGLVESMAYGMDILHYYLDRVANEAYLPTAVQKDSILTLSDMFGYVPYKTSCAVVNVSFSNTTDHPITLKPGTRMQSAVQGDTGDTIIKFFELTQEVIVPEASNVSPGVTVGSAQEGRTYREEFIGVSDGYPKQEYMLARRNVLPYTPAITIKMGDATLDTGYTETQWNEVVAVDDPDIQPFDEVFQAVYQTDESVTIRFGDGVRGKIPPMHGRIYASYRVGGGIAGNVPTGAISQIVEPIIPGMSVTNNEVASGGADAETIDSIRLNASRSFRSKNRAVTTSDFVSVALSHPEVLQARAQAWQGTSILMNIIHAYAGEWPVTDPDSTVKPSSLTLESIRSYIQDRTMAGVTVQVFAQDWVPIFMRIEVLVAESVKQSVVLKRCQDNLANKFNYQSSVFNGTISGSDISSCLSNIVGVVGHSITNISRNPDFTPLEENDSPTKPITIKSPYNGVYYVNPYDPAMTQLVLTGGIQDIEEE